MSSKFGDGTAPVPPREWNRGARARAVLRLLQKVIHSPIMPTVTVKLSQTEFSKLETLAARSRRTKSAVLREALARSGKKSPSLLDAMRPYIGKLRGPGDLSINKSRMKGYGASRSR